MTRTIITDEIWEQLRSTLKKYGCRNWGNNRNIMEAILWKLRVGAPWRDIPSDLCAWQTAFSRFNRWAKKGLWDRFFLTYEEKLTRNGYSSMEVMYALISMRVELGMATKEQLVDHEGGLQQKYILPPTRMEIRLILKSLGVTSMIPRLQVRLSKK